MRALLLAVLLAAPAFAQDEEAGHRAQKAREAADALPVEARVELKKMYRRYKEIVARRLEEGWRAGLLSEAVIAEVDEPFQPARLASIRVALRRKEADRLQEALKAVASDDPYNYRRLRAALEAKRVELAELVARSKREKGLCRDWSDQVWSELVAMDLEHWQVRDERRGARPYHTAAVACAPADAPDVCLAFDPWEDGRPSVFAFGAWDESAPGGRFPAEYFLHGLPDKTDRKP